MSIQNLYGRIRNKDSASYTQLIISSLTSTTIV